MKNKLQECWDGLKGSIGNGSKAAFVGTAAIVLSGVSALAQGTASPYVSQLEDAADQMSTDIGATVPIALGVAVLSVGVFIVWGVFKRMARG